MEKGAERLEEPENQNILKRIHFPKYNLHNNSTSRHADMNVGNMIRSFPYMESSLPREREREIIFSKNELSDRPFHPSTCVHTSNTKEP